MIGGNKMNISYEIKEAITFKATEKGMFFANERHTFFQLFGMKTT